MTKTNIGAVVIGRNEGERLLRCVASVVGTVQRTVYVDSGSTDGSVAVARAAGAQVVELDRSQPFTAARARNAGLKALSGPGPLIGYVQFIDGDCELDPAWLASATALLDAEPSIAVACGRRRERYPHVSIYNRLCDSEWNTPIGPAKACGGDSLARMSALLEVGGFNPSLIAGEEPEMCVRLRQRGWGILRVDAPMTTHDAAMTQFSQWWKRARRAGYAAAEGMFMHGAPPERHGVAQVRRALLWGFVLPLLIIVPAASGQPWTLLLAMLYAAQFARIAIRRGATQSACEDALFSVVGKFPELLGIIEFGGRRLLNKPAAIIEYKGSR